MIRSVRTNEKRGVDSMKVISGIEAYDGNKKTAVTLGKFDGLHRGHQKLLEKVLSYRGDGCEAVVCAFDMHRDSLMTVRERRAHLSEKADWLIEQPLSGDFMSMEAETFIEQVLYRKLHAAHLVVGADFNFGRGRRGNARMLESFAGQYGYTVDVVDKERYLGTVISSIRAISALIVSVMTRDKMIMIGALTSIRMVIIYAIWMLVISVVSLVTRLEVEKWSMFLNENSCIL